MTDRQRRGANSSDDPFGVVLPDQTRDEDDAGWGDPAQDPVQDPVQDPAGEQDRDEQMRRDVPPHHG